MARSAVRGHRSWGAVPRHLPGSPGTLRRQRRGPGSGGVAAVAGPGACAAAGGEAAAHGLESPGYEKEVPVARRDRRRRLLLFCAQLCRDRARPGDRRGVRLRRRICRRAREGKYVRGSISSGEERGSRRPGFAGFSEAGRMSLARRIIPCLDVDGDRVVKGVNFVGLRDAGDPAQLAARYNSEGADELVVLDIAASRDQRPTFLETIRRVAAELAIPLTAGGGIRSAEDARAVLRAGADKITLNTAAVARPELISETSLDFGAQAIVLAIDAKREGDHWTVMVRGGRESANRDAITWAKQAVALGAGEILVTSMDRDGTKSGFDTALTAAISSAVSVPVIASGGAKLPAHFVDVFTEGRADAALAASIFHDDIQPIRGLKEFLATRGIPVRLPC